MLLMLPATVVAVVVGLMVVVGMIEAAATVVVAAEDPLAAAVTGAVVVMPRAVVERGLIMGARSVHSRFVGSNRCTELAAAPAASQHGNRSRKWRAHQKDGRQEMAAARAASWIAAVKRTGKRQETVQPMVKRMVEWSSG